MFKRLIFLTVVLTLCSWNAFAAYIGADFNGDTVFDNPAQLTLNPGDTFTLDLYVADVPAGDGLVGYGFTLSWDSTVLQRTSPTLASSVPVSPWLDFGLSADGSGYLNVQAGSWPPGTSQEGTFRIATMGFTCLSSLDTSLSMTDWAAQAPNWVTFQGNDITADLFGPTGTLALGTVNCMNPVPIPAGIWLLGSGLLGLLGLRRKG